MSLSNVRKRYLENKQITEESFREVCEKSLTMKEACRSLEMQYSTFIRYARELNCYTPNQAGVGLKKPKPRHYPIEDYLTNKQFYNTANKLKHRLYKEGIKINVCELCGLTEWENKPLAMHLHHKNGDRYDNRLDNLHTLCPNCHSQTDTYTGKRRKT